MSLKTFHVIFISLAALLAFGFGIWCFLDSSARGQWIYVCLGLISFAVGVGLIFYETRFLRKLRGVSYL